MKVRKLEQKEHIQTRKLWEEIFTEDTPEFLDYYYTVKTRDNEIYVIEDNDKIVSMLHLNPYQMRIGNRIYQTHYIVAVATDEQYRRRGLMAQLLNYVLQVMTDRGEPFTFLMPASEAIYKPFGFEYIYTQGRSRVTGKGSNHAEVKFVFAKKKDCLDISEFANQMLDSYDVVTKRDTSYYETVLEEQTSENGGILLAKQNRRIVGVFCFAKEGHLEIREPLFFDKEVLQQAIYHLIGNEMEEVLCIGYGNEEAKPMIMAKVLQPGMERKIENAKVFLNEVV